MKTASAKAAFRQRPGASDGVLVHPEWLQAHLSDPHVRVVEVDVSTAAYDNWHIDGAVLWNIYADLKEGFLLLEAGRPEAEAVFYWRLNFWSHWGYHSAAALKLVHYYAALYLTG